MALLPRILGVATAGYSLAITARPELLTKPGGLADGTPPWQQSALVRSLGLRDVAIGTAMTVAPAGTPLRTALALRIAADTADAVTFGLMVPDPTARRKAAGLAGVWAAVNAVALARELRRS